MNVADQRRELIAQLFPEGLPDGNPFTNANKAIDHFLAHGQAAKASPPPRLHAGSSLPSEILRAVGTCLNREQWLPESGYLNHWNKTP